MLTLKSVSNVYWVNDSKTRASAVVTYEDDSSELLSITVSPDSEFWTKILELTTLEDIEKNTAGIIARNQELRTIDQYRAQERETQKKHNALFNAKLEAFDMQQVANASALRKSKIRRAKSVTEVVSHVAIAIMEFEKANADA